MIAELTERRSELEALCRRLGVSRLEVFGSAATGAFRPAESDIDFLVEFESPDAPNYADRYFDLLRSLEDLFDRPIDLVVDSAIDNPYFQASVERTKVLLCPQGSEALPRAVEIDMQPDAKKYLYDVERAGEAIGRLVAGKSFEDYVADELLRSGVERQFAIVAEGLNQLLRIDPELAGRITALREIVGFRNIIVHAYASIDDALVWQSARMRLPALLSEVRALLQEPGETRAP